MPSVTPKDMTAPKYATLGAVSPHAMSPILFPNSDIKNKILIIYSIFASLSNGNTSNTLSTSTTTITTIDVQM